MFNPLPGLNLQTLRVPEKKILTQSHQYIVGASSTANHHAQGLQELHACFPSYDIEVLEEILNANGGQVDFVKNLLSS